MEITIFGPQKQKQAVSYLRERGWPNYSVLFLKENGKPVAAWAYNGGSGGTLVTARAVKRAIKEGKDLSLFLPHHDYGGSATAVRQLLSFFKNTAS
jgi:hypothetical protein